MERLDATRPATTLSTALSPANRARFWNVRATPIRDNLLRQADDTCALVTRLPKEAPSPGQRFPTSYLTVMDWGHDERDYAAGHSDRAPRLSGEAWDGMVANIRAIADLARERHGVRAVIHPHAGGYVEFEDEVERIAMAIPRSVAGLCLDTGHTYYAGMDPVATLERYADRLDYIHFKDIDADVLAQVMGERIRFFEACARGVMCPIGRGVRRTTAVSRGGRALKRRSRSCVSAWNRAGVSRRSPAIGWRSTKPRSGRALTERCLSHHASGDRSARRVVAP